MNMKPQHWLILAAAVVAFLWWRGRRPNRAALLDTVQTIKDKLHAFYLSGGRDNAETAHWYADLETAQVQLATMAPTF
jgi:hypothetical protein